MQGKIKVIKFSVLSSWGLFLLIFIGSINAFAQPKNKDSDGNEVTLDMKDRQEINTFLDACREKALNNPEQAANKFLEVISINPANHAAHYELARILESKSQFKEAISLLEQAIKLDPTNIYYLDFKADVQVRQGSLKDAVKSYQKILKIQPQNMEVIYKLADTQILSSKFEDAIGSYDLIENITGVDEELIIQKEKLWLQLNKLDKAEAELKKLIEVFPSEVRYYNLLAELYRANNMPEKAFEVYQKVEKISPDEAFLNMQLADYYRTKGDRDKSFFHLKKAFANRNLDIDTKMKVLISFYTLSEANDKMKGQAYELLEILEDTHSNDAKAWAVYGDFLYRDTKWNEAKEKYKKCLDLDKSKYPVWTQYLIILSQLRENQELVKSANEAIDLFPVESFSYLMKGIAQIQLKQYSESVSSLKQGKSLTFERGMQAQFWTSLGDAYNELKQSDKSDSSYTEALKIEPNNANVLNNFSYYLSVRKKDLTKAKEMSKKSNDLEPNNSSYQDTYGWILFQMGEYAEAKVWIEKAVNNGGETNGTLLEHLGDVEYKLGNISKATELWQKAKAAGDTTGLIDQKLKEGKYIE